MEETGEHIDPTFEITLTDVKKRAVKGVAVLTSRSFFLYTVSLVAQGILWALLDPTTFGVFYAVSATVNFLSYFADIGLGAALIQKKEKPKEEDYKTVFTVQEILVLTIFVIIFFISPLLKRTHSLSDEGIILLYALNFSFFLASLKNIPSIILERKLEFQKFVIPQILENVVYYLTLVYFAWKGFGITSFTYAVIIRGFVGVVAIYFLQPWKPGIAFSKESLKSLLSFGFPYQLNNFLATIKDDGMTIVLGGILGTYWLGILGWAKTISQLPLRFIMDNVTKVAFPAFSRMQHDRLELSRALERSVLFVCTLIFPLLLGLVILFPAIIEAVPKWGHWKVAYFSVILLSASSAIAAVTTQLTNFFASIGKIKINLKLMVMWTVLTWIFLPYLSKIYGANGAALGYLLVGMSSFVVFNIVKKHIDWSLKYSVVMPFIASVVMGLFLFFVGHFIESNILSIFVLVFSGGLVYVLVLYTMMGSELMVNVKKTLEAFKRK